MTDLAIMAAQMLPACVVVGVTVYAIMRFILQGRA
jgi:hypothetical protein